MNVKDAKNLAWAMKTNPLYFNDAAKVVIGQEVSRLCGRDVSGNRRITVTDFVDMVNGIYPLDPSKL